MKREEEIFEDNSDFRQFVGPSSKFESLIEIVLVIILEISGFFVKIFAKEET